MTWSASYPQENSTGMYHIIVYLRMLTYAVRYAQSVTTVVQRTISFDCVHIPALMAYRQAFHDTGVGGSNACAGVHCQEKTTTTVEKVS